MPSSDDNSHWAKTMERDLDQARDQIKSGKTVLTACFVALAITWLLGLEPKLAPVLELRRQNEAAERRLVAARQAQKAAFEATRAAEATAMVRAKAKDLINQAAQAEETLIRLATNQPPAATLEEAKTKAQNVRKDATNAAQTLGLEVTDGMSATSLQVLAKKDWTPSESSRGLRRQLVNAVEFANLSDTNKTELQKQWQDAKSRNVSFEFPILKVEVPTIVAPLFWFLMASSTVGYLLSARRQIFDRIQSAIWIGRKRLSLPGRQLRDIVGGVPWWLYSPRTNRDRVLTTALFGHELRARPHAIVFAIFWLVLGVAASRIIWLSYCVAELDDQPQRSIWAGVWCIAALLLAGLGIGAFCRWLTGSTSSPGSVPPHPHSTARRAFFTYGLPSAITLAVGFLVMRDHLWAPFFPQSTGRSKWRPRKRYFLGRRKTYPVSPIPSVTPGNFYANRRDPTVLHYVFPADAYHANPPSPRTKPNPAKPTGPFFRSPPPKNSGTTTNPTPLDQIAELSLNNTGPFRVVRATNPTAFEHASIRAWLAKPPSALALSLAMAGVRQDLERLKTFASVKPNFRGYDLAAALAWRSEDQSSLNSLINLVEYQLIPTLKNQAKRFRKMPEYARQMTVRLDHWKNPTTTSFGKRWAKSNSHCRWDGINI